MAKMACSRAKDGQWKATQSCIETETDWEKKERQSKEHLVEDSDGAEGDGVFPETKHRPKHETVYDRGLMSQPGRRGNK